MAYFLVRVQLDGQPDTETYTNLHSLMSRLGFNRFVDLIDSKGKSVKFQTPHATYYGIANISSAQLRDKVKTDIQASLWSDIEILVVQTIEISVWAKLEESA